MPGTSMPALSWPTFWGAWHLAPGWLCAAVLLVVGYVAAWVGAGRRRTVPGWRAGSFATGCVALWACNASGVGAFAMSVFWMHMMLHLLLIMVVPALLVLGHPVAVALDALPAARQERAMRLVRSRPVTLIANPATGLAAYTVVIVGTHLTGFMDQMTLHPWMMVGEQVLYVVTGYLFLLPLLCDEPIRSEPPYLARLVLLLLAMVPDTLVGIVLLQTDHDLFPVMMRAHASWAPAPVDDIHVAGGLMWAGGDALMMALAIGVALAMLLSPGRRTRMTGPWLDAARRTTLADRSGTRADVDPDSDVALAAYNAMLGRLEAASAATEPREPRSRGRHDS